MSLQNDLANYSFLSLLGSMILYWVSTLFGEELSSTPHPFEPVLNSQERKKEEAGLGKALRGAHSPQNWFAIQNLARYGIIVSNILLGLLLILRWKESGHFPLSNLYESLMFLSWCFTGLYLFIDLGWDLRYANLSLSPVACHAFAFGAGEEGGGASKAFWQNTRLLLGAITTPSALLTNAFATFTLPKEMQEATPLVPALQSNWLMMHVTVMVLSYAALILGSLLSIAFLIVTAFAGYARAPIAPSVRVRLVRDESEGKEAKLKEYQNTTAFLQSPSAQPASSTNTNLEESVPALLKVGKGKTSFFEEARFFAFSPLRSALPTVLPIQKSSIFDNQKGFDTPQGFDMMQACAFAEGAGYAFAEGAGADFQKPTIFKPKLFAFSVQATGALSPRPFRDAEGTEGLCAAPNEQNIKLNSAFNSNISPLAITLDNLSYRILGIGFPFLTIGILSGAVWANEAWGSYWSWDPKETWALLTWLIFAIYLHTRLSKGWEGKKPAIIASLGFVIVWICYLGVNLIGEGLHSYGWISST